MIYLILALWWIGGAIGYFLMRQGFLVTFERPLGKKQAWGVAEIVMGIVAGVIVGWLFVPMAFAVKGRDCIRKRIQGEPK